MKFYIKGLESIRTSRNIRHHQSCRLVTGVCLEPIDTGRILVEQERLARRIIRLSHSAAVNIK
ncbi:MAG: hypothetical protein P9M15_07790 [Candidatus Electryoneaceae bacterium]|nr:hypothetical protein [Candidatus Electryoneaceae bacterium]